MIGNFGHISQLERSAATLVGFKDLITEKHLTETDALALASVGCDFHVAEAVDLTQVVVGKIPKNVFREAAPSAGRTRPKGLEDD